MLLKNLFLKNKLIKNKNKATSICFAVLIAHI